MEKKRIELAAGSILLLIGLFSILNAANADLDTNSKITGAYIGAESSVGSAFFGIIFILTGTALLTAIRKSKLEEKIDVFVSYRKGSREVIFRSPNTSLTSSGEITLDDFKTALPEADEETKEEIRKQYSGMLYSLRDGNHKKLNPVELKKVDEILQDLEGKNYRKHLSREEALQNLDRRYSEMVEEHPYYVHFTSNDGADRIMKGGFKKPGEKTYIQALVFGSKGAAEEFVDSVDQNEAKKITGCRDAERAVIFTTDIVPFGINTVMSGKAKALYDKEITRQDMKDAEKKPVRR